MIRETSGYLINQVQDRPQPGTVQTIGKQLGMKPEEVFRMSDFS